MGQPKHNVELVKHSETLLERSGNMRTKLNLQRKPRGRKQHSATPDHVWKLQLNTRRNSKETQGQDERLKPKLNLEANLRESQQKFSKLTKTPKT